MTGRVLSGYYGKVPANGDFITYRLPRHFVEPWDQWLQEGIACCRAQLGEKWLDTYLSSPVWRFGLSQGVCGTQAWAGLMLPSVDRVGRYFPLTLAVPVAQTNKLFFVVDSDEEWFSQAEQVALSALDHNAELAHFKETVNALSIPNSLKHSPQPEPPGIAQSSKHSNDNWIIGVAPPHQFARSTPFLTERLLSDKFSHFSLWWTSGSEQVEPSLLVCADLPPVSGFPALLDGNWDQWGWTNKYTITPPANDGNPKR